MTPFIGRQIELNGLKGLLEKKSASLVVIKGRRRIGKSRLAEEFGQSFSQCFLFEGLPPTTGTTSDHQKKEFLRQMKEYRIPFFGSEDWGDIFTDLAKYVQKGKILIVLDEISWLGLKDPTFLGKLKTAWDQHFKKNPHLVMILSGSQSTWIEKNILRNSGFVGRISYQLTLGELSLAECNQFWGSKKDSISPYEKLKILSITGGVPRYLEEVLPHLSAEENIRRLCFQPEGFLFHEFEQIFSDLFSKRSENYRMIVERLAEDDAMMEDIVKRLGRSKGGDIGQYLDDLCQTGFVTRDHTWSIKDAQPSKLSRYRLSDNYSRFYLKYISPNRHKIETGLVDVLPPSWLSVIGLQFENLVLNKKNRLQLFNHPSGNPPLQSFFSDQDKTTWRMPG